MNPTIINIGSKAVKNILKSWIDPPIKLSVSDLSMQSNEITVEEVFWTFFIGENVLVIIVGYDKFIERVELTICK